MERQQTDILVVGGGIAGLITTCVFATEGFDVTCIDPVPPVTELDAPDADLRSTAFLLPSVTLLDYAGLWPALEPFAQELRIMRLLDAGGTDARIRETAAFDASEIGKERFGYNLPNWLLRREIARRLADMPGARLVAPARFKYLTPRSGGAIVQLDGGLRIDAKLVIAADGRDSSVRRQLRIPVKTWRYGQRALVFNISHSEPHNSVSTEIHRTGGPFTAVPLPDTDSGHASAVVWMETGAKADDLFHLDSKTFATELNKRSCGILGTMRVTSPIRIWPIIAQQAARLYGPRTALVAEASHVVPPIGAQGLNMSLRDIACLRDCVVAARKAGSDFGAPGVLQSYARRRWPDVTARVRGINLLNHAAMAERPALRDLRRAGLKVLFNTAPLRKKAMATGLGLSA